MKKVRHTATSKQDVQVDCFHGKKKNMWVGNGSIVTRGSKESTVRVH